MEAAVVILTDPQISTITNLARPLRPKEPAAFMAALFEDLLMRRNEVGEGELGRTLRDLQRRYFQPPTDAEAGLGNYGAQWPSRKVASRIRAGGLARP
jgi:hypothetical protein